MLKLTSLSVVALTFAGAAYAGNPLPATPDPVVETAAPAISYAPQVDWTGAYVGGSFVGGKLDDGSVTTDTRGFGLQAGYLRDLGGFVVGGELAYVKGEATDNAVNGDLISTRLKAIGGYNAGKFLPYATLGVSELKGEGNSDTATLYGVGVKYAINASWTAGLEYVVEQKDNFDNTSLDVENKDLSLRLDYRF